MELNQFFEGIRMSPGAIHAAAEIQITEDEYEKNKLRFQIDRDSFYKEILKEEDYRIRFLYYFSRMACETWDCYRQRGLDEQIFWDTFYDLTLWCENCFRDYGEYGIYNYGWFFRHIECRIRRLGRLQFEEMDAKWKDVEENTKIQGKLPVINVHIPQGERLEASAVNASFEHAFRIWGQQIPYICDSWLLYPGLGEILPEDSNILQFQRLFRVTRVDFDGREAQRRIFARLSDDPADYPETTSLQRKVKKYLLEGKVLGSGVGILQTENVGRKW